MRIDYNLRLLQITSCLLVLLGHSIPDYDNQNSSLQTVLKYGYLFRMPLFFFISGYLTYNYEKLIKISFKDYFTPKFVKVIIPYFALNIIAFLPKTILNNFSQRKTQLSFEYLFNSFFYPDEIIIKYLWFLPVIFMMYLIFYLFFKIEILLFHKKNILAHCISLLILVFLSYISDKLSIEILSINLLIKYYLWFFLGTWFRKSNLKFQIFSNKFLLLVFSLFAIFLINTNLIYTHFLIEIGFTALIISILIGTVFFCPESILKNSKLIFLNLSNYYYQIYLLSWFFIVPLRILYTINMLSYEVCFILMFICGIIFPIILSKLIEKLTPELKILIGIS